MKFDTGDICKIFNVSHNKDWQWIRLKLRWVHLLSLKGLKCQICGENDIICLEFHHRDPNEKENQISYLNMGYGTAKGEDSFFKSKEEIKKCDLLCRRCHYEIHALNASSRQKKFLKIANKDRCEECGYSKLRVLDFHHMYGKDFALGKSNNRTKEGICQEIEKCKVLCKNCHKKVHKDMSKWKHIDMVIKLALQYDDFSCKTIRELFEEKVELIRLNYTSGKSSNEICKELGLSTSCNIPIINKFIDEKIEKGVFNLSWSDCIKRSGGDRVLMYPEINSFIDEVEKGNRINYELIEKLFGKGRREIRYLIELLRRNGVNYKKRVVVSGKEIIRAWNDESIKSKKDIAKLLSLTTVSLSVKISCLRKKYPELKIIDRPAELVSWNKGKVRELDEIDKKIIEFRSKKLTAIEIGKLLNISSNSIRLRCSKMIKMGIMERIPKELSNSWNIKNRLKNK